MSINFIRLKRRIAAECSEIKKKVLLTVVSTWPCDGSDSDVVV